MPAISPTHRQDPAVLHPDSRFRTFLDSMGLACVALDPTFQVLYCNPAYGTLVAVPVAELLGQSLLTRVPRFAGSPGHQACVQAMQLRVAQEAEEVVEERYLHIRAFPTPEGTVVVIEDTTPRRQLEDELVLSALRARLILEQVPAIHWAVDRELRFTLSMGAGLRTLAMQPGQAVGQTLQEFFETTDPQNIHLRMHQQALDGQRVTYLAQHAGRWYDCVLEPLRDHAGQIVGVIALAHDVTERRQAEEERSRLEQQVHRKQKLESLGLLASGIAHDFNNLLVGILGTAEVLLRDLPADAPQRSLVQLVKRAGENAADLTRQMLVYAGKSPSSRRGIDLNTLLRESQPLVSAAVRKNIALEIRPAAEVPIIHADSGQVQQVIMNLVLNAAEAVRNKGTKITLTTGVQEVNDPTPVADRDLAPGRYVFLEVADDGCGMTPQVMARIFDPFFTTKSAGRGLGMSVVQGIVRTHRGAIQVQSTPGEGTTFRVLLPIGDAPVADTAGAFSVRKRLVLVIDDEPCVRDVTTRALIGTGMATLSASNGKEGLELLRDHLNEVALVLLNLVMPGPGAPETLAAMRKLKPDLRVVLTTGHDRDDAMRLCAEWGLAGCLLKPYTLDALFEKVRTAIAG